MRPGPPYKSVNYPLVIVKTDFRRVWAIRKPYKAGSVCFVFLRLRFFGAFLPTRKTPKLYSFMNSVFFFCQFGENPRENLICKRNIKDGGSRVKSLRRLGLPKIRKEVTMPTMSARASWRRLHLVGYFLMYLALR